MMPALLLVLACGGAGPDPDRAAYTESLALLADDPAAGARACTRIQDPVLHGECALFAAAAQARAGGDGRPTCGGIEHAAWRGACFFEVAEAQQLRGEDARVACARAGDFQTRCLAHALNRDGAEAAAAVPDAAGMERVLIGRARALGLAGQAAEDAARDVVAQHLSGQWRQRGDATRPFRRTDCGTASAATCAKTYRLVVKGAAGTPRPTEPCAAGATREAVEAARLPAWDEDLAPLAGGVWAGICR
jgi:hypothetical protein